MTVYLPDTSKTSVGEPSSVSGQPSSAAFGRWLGTAEVYDGHGRFLGNGTDTRHVQQIDDQQIRIDVSFVGPFKHAGHYTITEAENGRVRLYQGPANIGYAETLRDGLIDAHAYWSALGLSQRFFLMLLPDGHTQLSLALMSRGEKLLYVVVGQNNRVTGNGQETAAPPPSLLSGTSYDLADDPTAGRGDILLHRTGHWVGELTTLAGDLQPLPATHYTETITTNGRLLHTTLAGTAFIPQSTPATWHTNQWEAWTEAGSLVGSYSLSGGRALSGHCHFLPSHLRLWRREVANHSGTHKAVLHTWYRGGVRVGVQFGVLAFEGGRRTEDGRRKTKDGGRRTEDRRWWMENIICQANLSVINHSPSVHPPLFLVHGWCANTFTTPMAHWRVRCASGASWLNCPTAACKSPNIASPIVNWMATP